MKTRYLRYVAAASVLLAISVTNSVAKPVALATSVTGNTEPAVEAFTELDKGAKITLDPTAEIEFLHYASCRTIVVRGGVLSFTAERFNLRRGKVLQTKRTKCPKAVALTGASRIGGVVLRSGGGKDTLRVATAPTFILVGGRAPNVETIRVSQGDRTIVEAVRPGRAFRWPADAPRLEKGGAYVVSVKLRGSQTPVTFNVEVKSRGGKDATTLIRLD